MGADKDEADEIRQLWVENAVTQKVLAGWRASYKKDVEELCAQATLSVDPDIRGRGLTIAMQRRIIDQLAGKAVE